MNNHEAARREAVRVYGCWCADSPVQPHLPHKPGHRPERMRIRFERGPRDSYRPTQRVLVEQGIARGWTDQRIADELGLPLAKVRKWHDDLDALVVNDFNTVAGEVA